MYEKFRFLEQLTTLSPEDVAEKASNLEKCYPGDLEFLDNDVLISGPSFAPNLSLILYTSIWKW